METGKKRKTILLTNDDGYNSPGIVALKEELERVANVVLVAPSVQKSGVGKTHSRDYPLKLRRHSESVYSFSGNPADCVQVALHTVFQKSPDLVVSGINRGENWGIAHFLLSGTQGAAIEGALLGIPSIAFSQYFNTWNERKESSIESYRNGAKVAGKICKSLLSLSGGFPNGIGYFNVNFPDGVTEMTPIEATKFSDFDWKIVLEEKDGGFSHKRGAWGKPIPKRGTDAHAILSGRISITPVKLRVENPKISKFWKKENGN